MKFTNVIMIFVQLTNAMSLSNGYPAQLSEIQTVMGNLNEEQLIRTTRSPQCAFYLGSACIPPCWKYAGRTRRRCTFTEKRKHLNYHFMQNM